MLEKNKKYILTFSVGGKLLTYEGIILDIDSQNIYFKDKYNKELQFRKDILISAEKIGDSK
ncbi:MAG: hypothetical protein QXU20_03850 [Candidatus Woesearchaeota archaeon]